MAEMKDSVFDVIVVGGGAGGVPAAVRAAQLGGRVAVIEEGDLGGMCMNRGCIPFGHMAAASHILGSLSLGKEMGIECADVGFDYARLVDRQTELISFMRQGVERLFQKNGVHLFKGRGVLKGPEAVAVNGKVLSARHIILATGGKWSKPTSPEDTISDFSNSDDLLNLKELPKTCLIYGNSLIAIQIAQFLQRFGCETTLITEEKSILNSESKPIRSRLKKVLSEENMRVMTKTHILTSEKNRSRLHCRLEVDKKKETVVVDRIIAVRRKASLEGLGLDTVGLDETAELIEVDEQMRTPVDGLYAIGDVATLETKHYSHAATAGGIVAAENAMGLNARFDIRLVPRVAFTQPQVACIGLTRKEAKHANHDVIAGTAPLAMNPFGMLMSQKEGIVEIVSEKTYGEILGVHILGAGACEIAGQAVLAMQMELTLEELAHASFPHPTISESLVEAARDALGWAVYLP